LSPECAKSHLRAVAKPGVSKWGVKGEGTGGGVLPPAGGPGAVPPENFSNYRCTQVSFSAFSDKVNALIPVFIPVNFGKIPNPLEF
jgi:hypothetical protein